jgi:deoxyadenosine/deoxycytidine kinase
MEYKAYEALASIHYPYLQYPDLQIHIDIDLDTEVERIKTRSRECEDGIDVSYLSKLNDAYNDLLPHLSHIFPVVHIDGSGDKQTVLEAATKAIIERMRGLQAEASGWPCYKKNVGFVPSPTAEDASDLRGLAAYLNQ